MPTTSFPPFADLLKRHRLAAGLSQEELAERAGMSPRTISDLERGVSRAPHRQTVDLLADALNLEVEHRAVLADSIRRRRRPRPTETMTAEQFMGALPGALAPLVGRERDEAQLMHLICRPDTRLLTLTGPGGVGKTRLAQRVGDTMKEDFPDGVVGIGLAATQDPALVPAVVAQAARAARSVKSLDRRAARRPPPR